MNIGVDFDGTLVSYKGYQGKYTVGEPLPGAVEWLKSMKAAGHRVIIFTARATEPEGVAVVMRWVKDNKLGEYIAGVTGEKLYSFDVFLDDRAIAFKGHYPSDAVLSTWKPWWKQ